MGRGEAQTRMKPEIPSVISNSHPDLDRARGGIHLEIGRIGSRRRLATCKVRPDLAPPIDDGLRKGARIAKCQIRSLNDGHDLQRRRYRRRSANLAPDQQLIAASDITFVL